MFGPMWMWLVGGGWTAKTVVDKLRQPPGTPPTPGAKAGAPGAPVAQQPPAVAHRPNARWDKNMDERMERAVAKYLEMGDPLKLRGFAASIDENVPPVHRARHHHPVAAFVMRACAAHIDQQRAQQEQIRTQQAAQAAAATQPTPAPTPPPAPAAHVNGAAKPATAAPVAVDPVAHPES